MKNSLEFDAFKFDKFFYKQKLIFPRFFFNFLRPFYPELEILSVQKPPINKILSFYFVYF